jgi:quercetin dioxygenase-like cupin family protein
MKIIEIKPNFSDSRGDIIDLIQGENIDSITMITLKKGAVRANHYHKETYQWNYLISGKVRIVTQFEGEEPLENIMKKGDFILTVPDEKHALQGIEDSELIVFTKGPRAGKEYESDTFRLEKPLIERN